MNENNQKYTIEQIKQAFWKTFHKSGEQWFDYLSEDKYCEQSTFENWKEFYENLTGEWLNYKEED